MFARSSRLLQIIGLILILLVSGYFYLYPGTEALMHGRQNTVMGDGTDSASLPYGYDLLRHLFENQPSRLFYGAVFVETGDPEKGGSLWIPWNERFAVIFLQYLFPVVQVSTAFIFLLMLLNGLAMYALCRYLRWEYWLACALSFSWAFNVYTRARAKVHGALVGIYHLPLIFLGLWLIARNRGWKSLVVAQILFLLVTTSAHYYLVTCIFLTPFFIAFVWIQPETRGATMRVAGRLFAATLPSVLFLAANYYFMLPDEAKQSKVESIAAEVMPDGSAHPFLNVYHAFPIDYLTGDLGLVGDDDVNPIRSQLSSYVKSNYGLSNSHERSNGIRWTLIILAIVAVIYLLRGQYRADAKVQRNVIFFLIFGLFGFWLSLSAESPTPLLSPSYWLYTFFPKIRVSSRAGILVHFSVLMLAGFLLSQKLNWQKWILYPGVLIGLLALDYPPLNKMPMAPIYPAYDTLHRRHGPCEVGLVFPFINPMTTSIAYYFYAQRMRGSDCKILNATPRREQIQLMTKLFPPSLDFVNSLNYNPAVRENLFRLTTCTPLNWIVFLEPTPRNWAQSVCAQLGWRFTDDMTCLAPKRDQAMQRFPSQCLY